MTFEELAAGAAAILGNRGFPRLEAEPGWCWESKINRVRFSAPNASHPMFPYLIVRQHFDISREGDRYLAARQPPIHFGPDETPERIAEAIESELTNPY